MGCLAGGLTTTTGSASDKFRRSGCVVFLYATCCLTRSLLRSKMIAADAGNDPYPMDLQPPQPLQQPQLQPQQPQPQPPQEKEEENEEEEILEVDLDEGEGGGEGGAEPAAAGGGGGAAADAKPLAGAKRPRGGSKASDLEGFFGVARGQFNLGLEEEWDLYRSKWPTMSQRLKRLGMGRFWEDAEVHGWFPTKAASQLVRLGRWYATLPVINTLES